MSETEMINIIESNLLHNLKGLNFHMLNIYKHDDKNIRYVRVCITHKI